MNRTTAGPVTPEQARHPYDYDINLDRESGPSYVVQMVGRDRRVLEIGAGPGSITRRLKEDGGCRVTAVERDERVIQQLSAHCDQVYALDLNAPDWASRIPAPSGFEVVVAADVLEHLLDPLATLRAMTTLVARDGQVVAALPNVAHSAVIAAMLGGTFDYQDRGLLDRTHIRFYCVRDMQTLFDQASLKIIDARFVVRKPEETDLAAHWERLGLAMKRELLAQPYGNVYQVVIKAVRKEDPAPGLNLLDLPVPARSGWMPGPPPSIARRIGFAARNAVRPFLSPEARAKIGDWLRARHLRL